MKTVEFNKLPKAVQREKICRDVIKMLKLEKYEAKSQTFIDIKLDVEPEAGQQIQTFLTQKNIKECYVCGLGSLMLSAVRLKNSLKMPSWATCIGDLDDLPDNDDFGKVLRSVFSPTQMQLIETAFECGDGYYVNCRDIVVNKKAVEFGNRFEDENERLLGIMKNIIANKGTFKP